MKKQNSKQKTEKPNIFNKIKKNLSKNQRAFLKEYERLQRFVKKYTGAVLNYIIPERVTKNDIKKIKETKGMKALEHVDVIIPNEDYLQEYGIEPNKEMTLAEINAIINPNAKDIKTSDKGLKSVLNYIKNVKEWEKAKRDEKIKEEENLLIEEEELIAQPYVSSEQGERMYQEELYEEPIDNDYVRFGEAILETFYDVVDNYNPDFRHIIYDWIEKTEKLLGKDTIKEVLTQMYNDNYLIETSMAYVVEDLARWLTHFISIAPMDDETRANLNDYKVNVSIATAISTYKIMGEYERYM